jgi:uncharacterized membrane protein YqiK
MKSIDQILIIILIEFLVLGIIYLFIKLAKMARKENKGFIIMAVTILGSGFTPDPNMEQQLRVLQEEKRNKGSEGESCDPDPYTNH